ncbi:MAG TPA: lysylphosphatidylglycerol synthase transmembrane domain-containing protein [Candidatus Saccharimonadales bacterium]|nr:lysylphosphatidylglycerol synthase transmembrane domain-containing protein [Candidatus Saccharimonadales bacterium]
MGKTSFVVRNWKLILNLVTVGALCILVYAIRHQVVDTFHNLFKVNGWFISLMIPIELLNYHAQVRMYQAIFGLVGNRLSYGFLYRASLELNFVNHVFPSGGVSGISYFSLRMKNNEITASKATLVHFIKIILIFMSFEILFIFGLLFMAIGGKANNLVVLVTSSLATLVVVATVAFVFILGSERRIHATFSALTRTANKLIHVVRPHRPETISMARAEAVVEELHQNYKLIERNYRQLQAPFWWAFVANVTEILAIYVVYIAFGEWVNLGAVILAYAVANFAGVISVLPGGIGIYEALMTGVLAAAGIPAALSLPVTVMYRVINTLIQITPGYFFYHKTLRGSSEQGNAG